jgi:hypothetical protein
MALPKELKDAVSAIGGRLGQPVDDSKLFDELASFIAKQKKRGQIGAQIGLASRADARTYFQKLVRESALGTRVTSPKKPTLKFSGESDGGSESEMSEVLEAKVSVDEASSLLKSLGIDLPAEVDKAIEIAGTVVECAVAISEGAASGAATGALVTAGACASGIGCIATAAGTAIGTVIGVIAAAWDCGLIDLVIEGIVFLIDTVGEFLTEIFDPKPENFSWYIDVAGPALRPTGWTPSSDYDRRFFTSSLANMPPAVRAEAEKAMTTRIAGSKLSGFTGVWLIRRTRELGGGAEEWARVSNILGVERGPQKKDATLFENVKKAIEKLPSDQRSLMKPVLVNSLVAGGFNAVEAEEKVYGKKAKGIAQSRLELTVLRYMLDGLQPGTKELEERKAVARKLISLGVRPPMVPKATSNAGKIVGAAALLGASYALASPVPALLGAGLYWLVKRSPKTESAPVVKMSDGMANRVSPKGS